MEVAELMSISFEKNADLVVANPTFKISCKGMKGSCRLETR